MNNSFLYGFIIATSGLWARRLGYLPLPLISLFFSSYSFFLSPKLYLLPTYGLLSEILLLTVHLGTEVDVFKSFFRIVLPLLLVFLLLPRLVTLEFNKLQLIFKYFVLISVLVILVDFSGYISYPFSVLTAPLNPYLIKDKTILFSDGNWSAFLASSLFCIETIFTFAGRKSRFFLYSALIYISGSRAAFLFLLINLVFYIINNLNIIQFKPLIKYFSNVFGKFSFVLVLAAFLFPFYVFFVIQGGELLERSSQTVSLSLSDGSLQTKFMILKYATDVLIQQPIVLFIGLGPQIELDSAVYAGHNLIGITVELGLLGILPYLIPQIMIFFSCKRALIPFSAFMLLQVVAFFPLAYSCSLLLWVYVYIYRSKAGMQCNFVPESL